MRFKLRTPHYLNVPGTEWEQVEQPLMNDRMGRKQRQVRHRYAVCLYLDPSDSEDWNYPGMIVVANKSSPDHAYDIIFIGPPTHDMEALDDEARAAIAALPPITPMSQEALPAQGPTPGVAPDSGVQKQLDELRAMVANLAGQLTITRAERDELAAKAAAPDLQPVVDDLEPLPPPPTPEEAQKGLRM